VPELNIEQQQGVEDLKEEEVERVWKQGKFEN
jgi:hypothetical protein